MIAADLLETLLGAKLDANPELAQSAVVTLRDFIAFNPPEALSQLRAFLDKRWDEQLGPREITEPTDPAYTRELERWYLASVNFLSPEFAEFAHVLYWALLLNIRGLQGTKSVRLHKGAPYNNLGVVELLRRDLDTALDYFILAAFEDALTYTDWTGGHAAAMLAAYWNGDVEIPRVLALVQRASEYADRQYADPVDDRARLVTWNPELLLMNHLES